MRNGHCIRSKTFTSLMSSLYIYDMTRMHAFVSLNVWTVYLPNKWNAITTTISRFNRWNDCNCCVMWVFNKCFCFCHIPFRAQASVCKRIRFTYPHFQATPLWMMISVGKQFLISIITIFRYWICYLSNNYPFLIMRIITSVYAISIFATICTAKKVW